MLGVRLSEGASRIATLRQAGSSKLLFPHGAGPRLTAVWLNTAGGITGGDCFTLTAEAGPGAALALTSQAAERVYRASGDAPGEVRNALTLGAGACLHWLPQETILFQGAALDRTLTVDMATDARFLGVETLLFGRRAMGETITRLHLRDRIDLTRAGRLVYADRLRLDGDAQAALDRAFVAGHAQAVATLVCARPGAAAQLEAVRARIGAAGGASALDRDLIVARLVAADGFDLRQCLLPLLGYLSEADLPRPWTL